MVGLADCQAVGLEVKPLEMRALGIWANCQLNMPRVARVYYFDVAAVEVRADAESAQV